MNKKEKNRRIKLFKEKCNKFQKLLNMLDYEMFIEETEEKDPDFRARFITKESAKMLGIFYSPQWLFDNKVKDTEISLVAFHEVYEALFSEVKYYLSEDLKDGKIDSLIHPNVRLMENLLFPLLEKLK